MSPKTIHCLTPFIRQIHWNEFGHPDDTDRFLDFIISAYKEKDLDIPLEAFLDTIQSIDPECFVGNPKILKRRTDLLVFMYSKYEDGIKLLLKARVSN